MEKKEIEKQVEELLGSLTKAQGIVVESVSFNDRGQPPTLQIVVDHSTGTNSVSLDEIGEISRLFSDTLDSVDPIGSEYLLEVSTPGAESDLKQLRHYQRNYGRLVQVKLSNGEKIEGILESADDDGFSLKIDSGKRYFEYRGVKRVRPRVRFGKGGH